MKKFTASEAIAIAHNAYRNAVYEMGEGDLLDDFNRDSAVLDTIKSEFMKAAGEPQVKDVIFGGKLAEKMEGE